MKKLGKRILVLGLSGSMVLSAAGCGGSSASETTQAAEQETQATTVKKIGVAIYSNEDDEVNMFRNYYENYLENSFEVEFLYSPEIATLEDEKSFVDEARKEGCEGIISFATTDLQAIVDYCGDDMYYAVGSATMEEEDFETVKDDDHFLGIIGPSSQDEYDAGADMIKTLAGENGSAKNYLIMSGGAGMNNFMHKQRLTGIMETLETNDSFKLSKSVDEIAALETPELVGESSDGGKIYVAPGYYNYEEGKASVLQAFDLDTYDVAVSVCSISDLFDEIADKESEQGKDIQVGTVDCFSLTNQSAFAKKDAYGNETLNYIAGKCEAMAAPAFVAMYNAITGHPEVCRDGNQAYWLNQSFWTATTSEKFEELQAEATNIYQNSYGSKEMMENIYIFNEQANFDAFKEFVGSL